MMKLHQRLALLSGIFGAIASCLAKFAVSMESSSFLRRIAIVVCHFINSTVNNNNNNSNNNNHHHPNYENDDGLVCLVVLEWSLRIICFVGMIVLNAVMMGTFLEGMEESGSVAGTGMATAANFATSAILGIWLWDERVNPMWMIGFTLVLIGVLLLSQVKSSVDVIDAEHDDNQKNNNDNNNPSTTRDGTMTMNENVDHYDDTTNKKKHDNDEVTYINDQTRKKDQ